MWYPSRREILFLGIIFIASYLIRGIPSWFNWGWGNDFGIYYGLSQSVVDDPQLFKPYTGWGQTYHYFPMLFIIMAGLHGLTGIEVDILLRVVSPILGSLSVVLFYFVVKRFHVGEYTAFLTAMLLALNPFHAYQTAHAAPLTVGHLFLMLSLALFLRKDDKPWATHALYLSSILLIMSHHLTTFIYILIIIGIFFFRGVNAKKRPKNLWTDLIYIITLTIMTFAYWMFIATPVFYSFMKGGLYLSPYMLVGIFYLLLGALVILLELKYRYGLEYKPRLFSKGTELSLVMIVIAITLGIAGVFTITDFGTGFTFLSVGIILLIPTLIIYSIAIVGANRIDFEQYGPEVKGIFYPILGIFLFSLITWNNVLLPYRFLEYLAYPICILSALGIIALGEIKSKTTWSQLTSRVKTFLVIILAIMVISGSTTYAVQRTTSRFEESISSQVNDAIIYLESTAPNNVTIASDHRISNVLWQRGFNTTYDYAYNLWFSETWNDTNCLNELNGHGTEGREFGRIEYVVIDSVMTRDGVQSNINETPRVINATGYEKFNHEPFNLVYESVSEEKYQSSSWLGDSNGESTDPSDIYPYLGGLTKPLPDALNWCRIYSVNWSYINDQINI
jgi:hypothetical protein